MLCLAGSAPGSARFFALPVTFLAQLRGEPIAVRGSAPGSARRAGHFHLLAQMKVTKAKSLGLALEALCLVAPLSVLGVADGPVEARAVLTEDRSDRCSLMAGAPRAFVRGPLADLRQDESPESPHGITKLVGPKACALKGGVPESVSAGTLSFSAWRRNGCRARQRAGVRSGPLPCRQLSFLSCAAGCLPCAAARRSPPGGRVTFICWLK